MKHKKSIPLTEKKRKNITHQPTIKINNDFKFSNILGISIVVFLGIVIYSNSFDCSFHFDDIPNIVENSMIHRADFSEIWKNGENRFLGNYSFAINYLYGELNVWGYHFFNLIIHLINACLVYWLTHLIFSSPVLNDTAIAKDKNFIAFITALLFVSHPLATQSVTYIVQRLACMVTLFYLLSIALYIKGRLVNNNKFFFFAGALVSTLMAMMTKENSYTLPLAVILVEFCFLQTRKIAFNFKDFRFLIVIAVFIGVIAFAFSRFSLNIFKPIPPSLGNTYTLTSSNYLLTQFSVIVKYIQLLFLPINQNLDYDFPISYSFFEMRTIFSFLFLTSLFSLAVYLFNKQRIISFGIFWFFLCISIESSIIPLADVIFEHRTYLPSFGFFLILSSGIYMLLWNKNRYLVIFLFLIIISANARISFQRNEIWADEYTLNSDIVAKSPNKPRTKVNMGMVFVNRKQLEKALPYFLEAKNINPLYFDAVDNVGGTYLNLMQWDSAIVNFTQALQIAPSNSKVYNGRGRAYSRLKQWDKAIADFDKAIELRPRFAEAYANRGLVYSNIKEYDKAILDYTKGLEIDPGIIAAYCNRGNTYAMIGQLEKALVDLSSAINIDSKNIDAYISRGITYGNLGQWKNAADDFSKAIELNPNNKNAISKRDNAIKQINNVK